MEKGQPCGICEPARFMPRGSSLDADVTADAKTSVFKSGLTPAAFDDPSAGQLHDQIARLENGSAVRNRNDRAALVAQFEQCLEKRNFGFRIESTGCFIEH